MEIIGLDLPKRHSQLSMKAEDGTSTDRRIVTSRERFTAVLGARPRGRILLEASTESEWVARHLESLGHDVIVADPNYTSMDANRSRRTKTDQRDARTLRDTCETAAYRPDADAVYRAREGAGSARWLAGAGERECLGAHADRRPRSVAGADHRTGALFAVYTALNEQGRRGGSAPRGR